MAPTGCGGGLFRCPKPCPRGAKLILGRLSFALGDGFVAIELGALVRQARPPRLELDPLQLLFARPCGQLPLGFPPTLQLSACLRQAFSGCESARAVPRHGLPSLLAPVRRFRSRRASAWRTASRKPAGSPAGSTLAMSSSWAVQGGGRAPQLAPLGLDCGALLSKGGQLCRQGGLISPRLEGGLSGSLERAPRRRADSLRLALRLPCGIRRVGRRGEVALAIEQPALRRRCVPLQLDEPGALLQPRSGAAARVWPPDEAVPAPQAAIQTDQPLPLAQLTEQPVRVGGLDHAHLSEAAAQGRRRVDQGRERPYSRAADQKPPRSPVDASRQ